MMDFHLTGRIIDKIILKNKPLLCTAVFMPCFQLYCLITQYTDHRGPQSREKKTTTMVFSSALEFTGHPLSVCLLLSLLPLLTLSLPFPPSPSAVTEQTGQVINSGATTLILSCRQGCLSSPFGVFCCAPATLGFRQTKHHKTVTEIYQTPFVCVFFFDVATAPRPAGLTVKHFLSCY